MSNPLTSPQNFSTPDAAGAKAVAAIAAAAPPTPPPARASNTPQAPRPADRPAPIDNSKLKPTADPIDDDDAFDTLIGHKKPGADTKPKQDEPAKDDKPADDTPPASDDDVDPFAIPAEPAKPEPAPAKADEQPTVQEPHGHRTRDYSKFHPDDAAILRKLPNELFAKYSVELPKLRAQAEKVAALEAKVAETANGPRYLHEHPEAIVLTPEYREAVNDLQQTEFEAQHYREQLLKIRRGEPWKIIEAWDKDGRPVYGPDRPAPEGSQIDLQADIQVNAAYQKLLSDADGIKTKLSSLVRNHSTRAQTIAEEVRATNKRIFKDVDLEKLNDEEKKVADIVRANIHPAFKDHPQSEALIYAGVSVTRMKRMLLETQEKLRKAEAALGLKQLAPAGAPTVGASGGLAATPGRELVNTREMFGDD